MARGFMQLIRDQRTPTPPLVKADLTGKTVMVIGANVGLGLEAVKHFCTMSPARVILACRSEAKGKEAVAVVKENTGFTPELWLVDLAKFSSVVAFAGKFEKDGGRLDVLVCNAGVAGFEASWTSDGFEDTLQVNHLASALLILLLLPRLVETARQNGGYARVVQVASDVHEWAKPNTSIGTQPGQFKAFSEKANCGRGAMMDRYNLSKLYNVMFVRAFSSHLKAGVPVVLDSVTPGYCYSSLRRSLPFPINIFDAVMEWFLARTTEEGSRQLIYAALGSPDDPQKLQGQYINLSQVEKGADILYTQNGIKMQAAAWEDTIKILSVASPKIQTIVQEYLSA